MSEQVIQRGDRYYFRTDDPRMREYEGRRWSSGVWNVPATPRADALLAALRLVKPQALAPKPLELSPLLLSKLTRYGTFQLAGVTWLRQRTHALLWDEQGLGKTVQAVAWASDAPSVLVLCPLTVVGQWIEEVQQDGVSGTLFTTTSKGVLQQVGEAKAGPRWIISSYERCSKLNPDSDTVIVDEAMYCRNSRTKRAQYVFAHTEKARQVVALTGHPMVNRPIELWSIFLMLKQRTQKEYWPWVQRYTGAYQTPYGWDVSGATHMNDLRLELEGFGLRRLRATVLPFLPPKRRLSITIPTPPKNLAVDDVLDYINRGQSIEYGPGFGAVQHLRIECANSKLKHTVAWLTNHWSEGGGKVVLFSSFKEPLHSLAKAFAPGASVTMTGDDSETRREERKQKFLTDPNCLLLLVTFGVGGVGLNLQVADTVVLLDLPWTPMELEQAEDRIHRIGQEMPVLIVTMLSGHPIELQMQDALYHKQDLNAAIKQYAMGRME